MSLPQEDTGPQNSASPPQQSSPVLRRPVVTAESPQDPAVGLPPKQTELIASEGDLSLYTSGEQVPQSTIQSLPHPEPQQEANQQGIDIESENEKKLLNYSFYGKFIDAMHESLSKEPEEPKTPMCNCCHAFDIINRLNSKRSNEVDKPFEKINNMTPVLCRARSKGWLLHSNMAFPFTNKYGRALWVGAELFIVISVLVLSIVRFSRGNDEIFNILHLALSILATVLEIIDVLALICSCPFRRCGATCRQKEQLDLNPDNNSTTGQRLINAFDFGRVIMSELIFYPLLICAIFDFITSEAYCFETEDDGISCALLVMSAILMVVFVFAVRIAVPSIASCNLNEKRFPKKVEGMSQVFDTSNVKSAWHLQMYFIFYTLGQILVQGIMLMGITFSIFYKHQSSCDSIEVDGRLRYMLAAGYILPILGPINFYLVTYYWFQEYSIGLSVDFIVSLQQNDTSTTNVKEGLQEKVRVILDRLHSSKLIGEFQELKSTSFIYKFLYPFQSPLTVIFAGLVFSFHVLFFVFAFESIPSVDFPAAPWTYWFLAVGVVFVYIMNLYAFSIVVFWSVIIAGIIAIVALILLAILLCCILGSCASNSSSKNNR